MVIFVVSTLIAITVSFLCSLMEAVPLSINSIRLETLKQQGRRFAAVWLKGPLRPRMTYLQGSVQFTIEQVRRGRVHQASPKMP